MSHTSLKSDVLRLLFLFVSLTIGFAAYADDNSCGNKSSGLYFEFDPGITPLLQFGGMAYVNIYKDGALVKAKQLAAAAGVQSSSNFGITFGSDGIKGAHTSVVAAGPLLVLDDGRYLWIISDSSGKITAVLSKAFSLQEISQNDEQLACTSN